MFWFLMWVCLAAAVVGGIIGQIKEKGTPDAEGAWFGWGLGFGIIGLMISIILSLIVGAFVQSLADDVGTEKLERTATYKVADKSRFDLSGKSLEFTYVDDQGTLQDFNKYVSGVEFQGTKRETVVVNEYQYVVPNILPWDIIGTAKKAIVK